jgi:hypothetical protein
MSADSKARGGMRVLVGVILAIALIVAGAYLFLPTPEKPSVGQPSPHAIDQSK